MGARISIQFIKKESFNHVKESPVLFSHWSGEDLLEKVESYLEDLKAEIANSRMLQTSPLGRLEPTRVMIDFIRYITHDMKRVDSDYYICRNEEEGDNSDNGHFRIDVDDFDLYETLREKHQDDDLE